GPTRAIPSGAASSKACAYTAAPPPLHRCSPRRPEPAGRRAATWRERWQTRPGGPPAVAVELVDLGLPVHGAKSARPDTIGRMLRGILVALLLSFGPTVSNSFARFSYALVLPAMREDLQLSYSQGGWLNTANALGYLAGAILTWTLVRRTGNRLIFGIGMVATAASLLATGMTSDLTLLTIARLLAGVGGAMVFSTGGALAGNIYPGRPELATTTILLYFAGAGIGLMLSGVALPLLLDARGDAAWPLAWLAMGWTSAAMTIAAGWAASRIEEPQAAGGSAS